MNLKPIITLGEQTKLKLMAGATLVVFRDANNQYVAWMQDVSKGVGTNPEGALAELEITLNEN